MKRICVFCGASLGNRPEFVQAAGELGRELVGRGIGLVYGGTSIGLMGKLADAVLEEGGEAIGVLPGALKKKEIAHRGLTGLHIVDSLAERKQIMFDLSEGFIVLPGGLGTLDELSEVLTWAQLGFHAKPIGLLNIAGYYDSLLTFLRGGVPAGLIRERHLELLSVAGEPGPLLDRFLALEAHPCEREKEGRGKPESTDGGGK